MVETSVAAKIEGGAIQGIVGAGQVVIHNLHQGAAPLPAPPEVVASDTTPPCPYPGLAYFGPQDGCLFFGREKAIAALEAAVTRHTFTALVGTSGTGKSSVVLAGLASRLHSRGGWRFSHFRISTESNNNPFMALARALVPLLDHQSVVDRLESVQRLAVSLESGAVSLLNVLDGCRTKDPGKRILLIADQFEELFTLVKSEDRRRRFQDILLAGFTPTEDGRPRDISLILTLRGDFYGAALRYRALSDALQGHVENLAPMTREELREAIVKPAGAVTFEGGLVDTLLDAVEERRGGLPLLQFALREMWDRMDHQRITRASYDAIGGVKGALANHAQAIFDYLTQNGKDSAQVQLFRQLFTRLVNVGDVVDTRRVVDREELSHDAWELAQRLAGENNRLVVVSAERNRETLEMIHETLIHGWPTLHSWIASDRRLHLWLRQLKPSLDAWREHPEDDGTLLRGGPLVGAEAWLALRGDDISEEERSYIAASVDLRDKTRRREEKHQLITRRFIQVTGAIIILGILQSGFFLWVKSNNENATWTMGWSALFTRTWLLFHIPPEPEMVHIDNGTFEMGSPPGQGEENEHPPHVVIVRAFEMGKYDVTFQEYDVFASATLRERPSDRGWGRQRRPVINVSWNDAIAYLEWLNKMTAGKYRLPSEAEWEYAARAGTKTSFWWGDNINISGERPHCNGCGSEQDGIQTSLVSSFQPNPWGLYDMAGNVWQWTADCWHDSYQGDPPTDGAAWINRGDCKSRVVRGGSWTGNPRDRRSAERLQDGANAAASDQGFRLARDSPR
jgi:formylglycine-generating enzyme required for sulfatase activity